MESWQKNYITKNLPKFLEQTKSNVIVQAHLLAENVFASADLEQLTSRHGSQDGINQAKTLFDLLFTRKNSYKAIGRAAFETKQSGTFFLLLKGLVEQLLQQCNIGMDERTLDTIITTNCLTDENWKFFDAKLDIPTLYEENWIVSPRKLYIPRHISNRIRLNPEVFQRECPDVFVFTGLTRFELTKLAAPNRTAASSEVIIHNLRTTRFVLLEHRQDWEDLQAFWPHPTHLIYLDSFTSNYILLHSTEPGGLVSSHVPLGLRDKSLYVPEDLFFRQINGEKCRRTICICDTPGMGKTWLLENMARRAREHGCNHIVAMINLQQFVEQAQVNTFNTNSTNTTQCLLRYLCPFRLSSAILESALQKSDLRLQLFLDGFDEIPKELLESTKRFFGFIAKNQENVSMFVTSRPHMRCELEETFKATAYDILPFSEEDQVDYLVRFWQNSSKHPAELQVDKLREFALECLKSLRQSFAKMDVNIMGIPLQSHLLATVNSRNAELYCSRYNRCNVKDFVSPLSMYDMYDIYVAMGIDKAENYHGPFNYETESVRGQAKLLKNPSSSSCQEHEKLKAFHVWKALQLLIPYLAEDYFLNECLTERKASDQILACGILQNCAGSQDDPNNVTFIHRSFAEYLVAQHFAEIVTGNYNLTSEVLLVKYLRGFVHYILSVQVSYYNDFDANRFYTPAAVKYFNFQFTNSATAYFLNGSLQTKKMMPGSQTVGESLTQFLVNGKASEILSACISSNHVNVIQLIKDLIKTTTDLNLRDLLIHEVRFNDTIQGFLPDREYLSYCAYICHAAKTSNVRVIEELYSLFEECLNVNLTEICSKMPTEIITPLHYAVDRKDYSLVEFFINQITLPKRCLLYVCLNDEYGMSESEDKNAIEICKLLLEKDSSIIFDKYKNNGNDCYVIDSIVLRVSDTNCIKFLVEHGADIRALHNTDKYVDTVVTRNARLMNKTKFSEFCQYLIYSIRAYDLFRPNLPHWGDPLQKAIKNVDNVTLSCILQIPGIKIHGRDDAGNNLILNTIRHKGELGTVQYLEKLGVKLFSRNHNGENALHFAVKYGSIDITEHLLSVGFLLEEIDDLGNTPLLHAKSNLNMLKCLVSKNANYFAVNAKGNNIAHLLLNTKATKYDIGKILKPSVEYLLSLTEGPELFNTFNENGMTPLHQWIAYHILPPDEEIIELVLQNSKCDVNAIDFKGRTMFLTAAGRRQYLQPMKGLLKFGANHNVTNFDEKNALHIASQKVLIESADYLVAIGVSIEQRDKDGNTPLLLAAYHTKMNMVKYLIERGANLLTADDNCNNIAHILLSLPLDSDSAHLEIVSYLLSLTKGPELFEMRNKDGSTPLHEWIASPHSPNDHKLIEMVLQSSRQYVNATDIYGNTMFLTAATNNNSLGTLICLKEFGANLNVVNRDGKNALHLAAEFGLLKSATFCVSNGVSLEHQDNYGDTPILVAAFYKNMEIVKYFVEQHANVLVVDKDGNNIAHLLLGLKHNNKTAWLHTVQYLTLLTQGAELLKTTNKRGRTPLHEWITSDNLAPESETFDLILSKSKENINATDKYGYTMFLTAAAKKDSLSTLMLLKEFGADHNVANNNGYNALHLARSNLECSSTGADFAVVDYLFSLGCR